MELAQLRAFVTVAAEGNLTRSAKKLFLTQPAVSSQILNLEKELGFKLFYRGPKGMILSGNGEALLEKAKDVLNAGDLFCKSALKISGSISGSVSCSYNLDTSLLKLGDLVSALSKKAPDVQLRFFQVQSTAVMEKLKHKEIDMGFILGDFFKAPLDVECIKLTDFHTGVVAPLDWADKLKNVKAEDLSKYPWIFLPDNCPFLQQLSHTFIKKNNLRASLYADYEDAVCELVSRGNGLSFMLHEEAKLRSSKLHLLEQFSFPLPLNLYYRKDIKEHPACDFVIKQLQQFWAS